jgi:hypothetical protein
MEGEATPSNLNNSLMFLDLFLYLSFFSVVGKEVGRLWEIVREDIGLCRSDCQLYSPMV